MSICENDEQFAIVCGQVSHCCSSMSVDGATVSNSVLLRRTAWVDVTRMVLNPCADKILKLM